MSSKTLSKRTDFFPASFDDFFKPWSEWFDGGRWGRELKVPAVNITENKGDYMVTVAAPGLKKSDFKIDVKGDQLTISSEKEESKEEKDDNYTRKEYNFSSFSRSFTLPEEVDRDKIEASYENGELKLRLPKKEEAKKLAAAKQIAVK